MQATLDDGCNNTRSLVSLLGATFVPGGHELVSCTEPSTALIKENKRTKICSITNKTLVFEIVGL
jgi:hypothetical protein